MMAARQINYASIYGSYVMKTQFEIAREKEADRSTGFDTNNKIVMQETVGDYIEQA